MKPTMKLRWRKAKVGEDCVAFGKQWRGGFSDDWGFLEGRVLQQWWEEDYMQKLVEGLYHVSVDISIKPEGEWRDIEVEGVE